MGKNGLFGGNSLVSNHEILFKPTNFATLSETKQHLFEQLNDFSNFPFIPFQFKQQAIQTNIDNHNLQFSM